MSTGALLMGLFVMQALVFAGFTVVTLVACAYGWFKGTYAEKSASATLLIGTFVGTMIVVFLKQAHSSGVLLALDGLLGLYFVHLAMRYGKMWMIGELVLMTIQFALQSLFVMGSIPHDTFALGNNIVTAGTLALLIYGTWRSQRDGGSREFSAAGSPA